MGNTIYKRFFEVRMLHDYYLFTENKSFFEYNLNEQHDIIEKKLRHRLFDLRKDLVIRPTVETKVLMERHKLRYFQTPLGFVAAIEVTAEMKSGDLKFKPKFSIPNETIFNFELKMENPYFRNFTEERLRTAFETTYYFTNQVKDQGARILSKPVSSFNADLSYEMGDLSIISGQLFQATKRNNDSNLQSWFQKNEAGYMHDDDRMLLSQKSVYHLPQPNTTQSVSITLSTTNGDVIKEIKYDDIENQHLDLDFVKDNTNNDIPSGTYQIIVEGNSGYKDQKTTFINNDLYNPGIFGVVGISNAVDNADNTIIDPDGFLVQVATNTSHPIFEIRMRSRTTFWRYLLDKDMAVSPDHLTFEPNGQNSILVSNRPRLMSKTPSFFLAEPPLLPERKYPNPKPSPLKIQSDGRIFSDLNINTIQKLVNA